MNILLVGKKRKEWSVFQGRVLDRSEPAKFTGTVSSVRAEQRQLPLPPAPQDDEWS